MKSKFISLFFNCKTGANRYTITSGGWLQSKCNPLMVSLQSPEMPTEPPAVAGKFNQPSGGKNSVK